MAPSSSSHTDVVVHEPVIEPNCRNGGPTIFNAIRYNRQGRTHQLFPLPIRMCLYHNHVLLLQILPKAHQQARFLCHLWQYDVQRRYTHDKVVS